MSQNYKKLQKTFFTILYRFISLFTLTRVTRTWLYQQRLQPLFINSRIAFPLKSICLTVQSHDSRQRSRNDDYFAACRKAAAIDNESAYIKR